MLGLDFAELEALRRFLAELRDDAQRSLSQYQDPATKGFVHKHVLSRDSAGSPSAADVEPKSGEKKKKSFSLASTSTCVVALRALGILGKLVAKEKAEELVRQLLTVEWSSAGLP